MHTRSHDIHPHLQDEKSKLLLGIIPHMPRSPTDTVFAHLSFSVNVHTEYVWLLCKRGVNAPAIETHMR
jgi:hypothetical protein